MIVQRTRSLLGGLLFVLIMSISCDYLPGQRYQNNRSPLNGIGMAPIRSTRFVSDGRRVVPAKLQNTPAELVYENRIGGYLMPRLVGDELYVVFRNNRRQTDTIYRLNSGNGEIVYIFNNNRQERKIISDHQVIFDISDSGAWSLDIFR